MFRQLYMRRCEGTSTPDLVHRHLDCRYKPGKDADFAKGKQGKKYFACEKDSRRKQIIAASRPQVHAPVVITDDFRRALGYKLAASRINAGSYKL